MSSLSDIEGIADVSVQNLAKANVSTVEQLLEAGGTPAGRKKIADESGISPKLILRWVNCADLFRIKGISSQYSELLEAAGVDTVVELAQRVPANLAAKMKEVNEEKRLCHQPPAEKTVEGWVAQAKELPRAVSY